MVRQRHSFKSIGNSFHLHARPFSPFSQDILSSFSCHMLAQPNYSMNNAEQTWILALFSRHQRRVFPKSAAALSLGVGRDIIEEGYVTRAIT